jgi:DNA-directed RNA polymerase specialized sigma24 family protein
MTKEEQKEKEAKRALADALIKRKAQGRSTVDEAKRKAILGAYLSGKSMGDVAPQCQVSTPTVKKVIDAAIAEGLGE